MAREAGPLSLRVFAEAAYMVAQGSETVRVELPVSLRARPELAKCPFCILLVRVTKLAQT